MSSSACGDLALHRALEEDDHLAAVGETEHVANGGDGHAAGPPWAMPWSSSESASRTEPSATRAISASASGSTATPSAAQIFARWRDHRAGLDPLQVEADAARAHRDRHLLDLGRREQELDVLGRLFERLQEAVESLLREHVHFVDDVDLGARRRPGDSARSR